ncbi:MAG TPA: hypothetical protein VJO53_13300 [Candidatus Acidoferrales bacterium]|nr:hypothetical protein [Candidatus Acidoferrales bacterium]
MRFVAGIGVTVLFAASLCVSPAQAAHRKVLGVVAQADHARLDGSTAVVGADVYSCDTLETDEGGTLRVRVGSSQVFLSSLSSAALEDDSGAIQVVMTSGTVGFSEPASDEISIRTPAGIVRAAGGQAATAQVTLTGPKELVVSAIHGDIALDNGGALQSIPEGKSADVTFEENLEPGCHDEGETLNSSRRVYPQHKIGFDIIGPVVLGGTAYWLWQEETESESKPKK